MNMPSQGFKFSFTPVSEIKKPLSVAIGISGPSGSGKTYSALTIAAGLADEWVGGDDAQFIFVDTEGDRGLHYKTDFPQMVYSAMPPAPDVGYSPEYWISAIEAVEDRVKASNGDIAPVVVFDSFSHAWDGVGGVLDAQALLAQSLASRMNKSPSTMGQLAWAQIKPRYKRLIDKIVQSELCIILCMRAKDVFEPVGKDAEKPVKRKTRDSSLPFDVVCDRDLIWEMNLMIMLDYKCIGTPKYALKMPDLLRTVFDPNKLLTRECGRSVARWARSHDEESRKTKTLLDNARLAADQGRQAFKDFWANCDRASRATVNLIMDDLKNRVEASEKSQSSINSDDAVGSPLSETVDLDFLLEKIAAASSFDELVAITSDYGGVLDHLGDDDTAHFQKHMTERMTKITASTDGQNANGLAH